MWRALTNVEWTTAAALSFASQGQSEKEFQQALLGFHVKHASMRKTCNPAHVKSGLFLYSEASDGGRCANCVTEQNSHNLATLLDQFSLFLLSFLFVYFFVCREAANSPTSSLRTQVTLMICNAQTNQRFTSQEESTQNSQVPLDAVVFPCQQHTQMYAQSVVLHDATISRATYKRSPDQTFQRLNH